MAFHLPGSLVRAKTQTGIEPAHSNYAIMTKLFNVLLVNFYFFCLRYYNISFALHVACILCAFFGTCKQG